MYPYIQFKNDCSTLISFLLDSGTSVNAEKAVQFARATGTPVSLHDLSLSYLAADYDPYMNLGEHPSTPPTYMMLTLAASTVTLRKESHPCPKNFDLSILSPSSPSLSI